MLNNVKNVRRISGIMLKRFFLWSFLIMEVEMVTLDNWQGMKPYALPVKNNLLFGMSQHARLVCHQTEENQVYEDEIFNKITDNIM